MKKSEMKKLLIKNLDEVNEFLKCRNSRDLRLHYDNIRMEILKSLCILNEWEKEDEE